MAAACDCGLVTALVTFLESLREFVLDNLAHGDEVVKSAVQGLLGSRRVVCLDTEVQDCFRRMWDGVTAEVHGRVQQHAVTQRIPKRVVLVFNTERGRGGCGGGQERDLHWGRRKRERPKEKF